MSDAKVIFFSRFTKLFLFFFTITPQKHTLVAIFYTKSTFSIKKNTFFYIFFAFSLELIDFFTYFAAEIEKNNFEKENIIIDFNLISTNEKVFYDDCCYYDGSFSECTEYCNHF